MNPIDVALNYEGCDFTSDLNEYIRQMEGCLAGAGTLACTLANRSTERRANYNNAKITHRTYQVGDLVPLWTPPKLITPDRPVQGRGLTTKLLHQWHGPYEILERISDVDYLIENARGNRRKVDTVHVRRLKPHIEAADVEYYRRPPEQSESNQSTNPDSSSSEEDEESDPDFSATENEQESSSEDVTGSRLSDNGARS